MPSFVVQFSILILLRLGSVSVSSFRSHSARFFPSHPHPHPHSHSRRGFSFGSPTSFLCMRIGEICVRVLNKNLLHILLYLRLCLTPHPWLPFLAKWKKIDVPATRPAQPAAGCLHPRAEADDGCRKLELELGAGSEAGAQAMPLCVVACIYSYCRLWKVCMEKKISEKECLIG